MMILNEELRFDVFFLTFPHMKKILLLDVESTSEMKLLQLNNVNVLKCSSMITSTHIINIC